MLLLQYKTIWFKFRNDKAKSMPLLQYTAIWFKFRNNTKYRIEWKNIWHDFRLGMHCFGLSRIYACFSYTNKLKCRFRATEFPKKKVRCRFLSQLKVSFAKMRERMRQLKSGLVVFSAIIKFHDFIYLFKSDVETIWLLMQ